MKRIMMSVIVATVLCMACQSFSDGVFWYSASEGEWFGQNPAQPPDSWLDYVGGVPVSTSSDWCARILTVGTELEVYATPIGGTHGSDWGLDGVFYQVFDYQSVGNPFNGQEIFTRFYNNADWTFATAYADTGFTTINWPSVTAANPPDEYFYNVGTNIVIPEPSTALLLGTGGLVVWFGRRKLGRDTGTKVTPKKMRKVDLLHR